MTSINTQEKWPDQPPRIECITAIVRSIAEHSHLVRWGGHVKERMSERGIDTQDLFTVLRKGDVKGEVSAGTRSNEWHCKLTYACDYPDSNREIGVVVLVQNSERIFVKTVEWEDI